MRVTVFGASGGVGKHVVDLALARGHTVRPVFRFPSTRPSAERFEPVVIPNLLTDGALTDVVRDSRISRADVAWHLLQSLERLSDPQRTPMITHA